VIYYVISFFWTWDTSVGMLLDKPTESKRRNNCSGQENYFLPL